MTKPLDGDQSALAERILSSYINVAVVGISQDTERPSYRVASYLNQNGFNIIPVTPNAPEILGKAAFPDLSAIPEKVEVVDIFRRPDAVPAIVEEAIKIGAKAVWMQEGVVNEEAAARAREAGLLVVMDRCMRKEHIRLSRKKAGRKTDGYATRFQRAA